MQRESGWRVDPLSRCHPAAERTAPSKSVRWVLRPVRALCCVPLRYLFPPLICQTLRHKHTLPLSIYLTPIGNSSLRPAPERRVCAQGEEGGRERIGYHLQYKGNEKGVFPRGLIHLPQITLHFLIQPDFLAVLRGGRFPVETK